VKLIHEAVELVEELLLFLFEILELLELDFVLPLLLLELTLFNYNLLLAFNELSLDFIVLLFLNLKRLDFFIGLNQGLVDRVVLGLLLAELFLCFDVVTPGL